MSQTASKNLMTSSAMESRLADMWEHRASGDIAASGEIFTEIAVRLNLDTWGPVDKKFQVIVDRGISVNCAVDFLLMNAAKLRYENKLADARAEITRIQSLASKAGVSQHFQIFFQTGVNELVAGQFSSALNSFYAASMLQRTQGEKLMSLLNQIICIESLGYDYSGKLDEFLASWDDASCMVRPWGPGVYAQFLGLKLRQALRVGDMSEFNTVATELTAGMTRNPSALAQAAYFALLVGHLPYFESMSFNQKTLEHGLTNAPTVYANQFRLRTLTHSVVLDDFSSSYRLGDKIERLYALIWQWLAIPDFRTIERAILWFEHVVLELKNAQVSPDEFILLENSLRWFALFSGMSDSMVSRMLGHVQSGRRGHWVTFDYEARLLDVCFALRDRQKLLAEDAMRELGNHKALGVLGFNLPSVAAGILDANRDSMAKDIGSLIRLKSALTSLRTEPNIIDLSGGVHVDALTKRIIVIKTDGSSVVTENESLVMLLVLVAMRDLVGVPEMLMRCFGLSSYDPTAHDTKVAHLLLAANRSLSPFMTFRRKRDQIAIERHFGSQESLTFVRGGAHIMQMMEYREKFGSLLMSATDIISELPAATDENLYVIPAHARPLQPEPNASSGQMIAGSWMKRLEFEAILGLSRATACRRISMWIDEGLVERRGAGRATQYRAKPELVFSIINEGENTHAPISQ
jgi:hypothetical protein